jgi:hypothetical protein
MAYLMKINSDDKVDLDVREMRRSADFYGTVPNVTKRSFATTAIFLD